MFVMLFEMVKTIFLVWLSCILMLCSLFLGDVSVILPYYTTSNSLVLSGVVGSTTDTFTINGNAPAVDEDGHFTTAAMSLSEGENLFTFVISDSLGNTQTITRRVILDTSAPTLTLPTLPTLPSDSGVYTTNSSTFSYSGSLSESGTLRINGSDVSFNDDGAYTFDQDIELIEGENLIAVQVADAYGNLASTTITVYLDLTPPQLSVASLDAYTNAASITAYVTAADSALGSLVSGIASVTLNGSEMIANGGGAYSGTVSLSEGNNTLTVVATDLAGNSTTQVRQVVRDTIAPQFIALDPSEDISVGTRMLSISGLINDASAWVTLNDGEPIYLEEGAFSAEYLLSSGANVISIKAWDVAGNVVEHLLDITYGGSAIHVALTAAPTAIASDRTTFTGTASPGATIVVTGALTTTEVVADAEGNFTTGTVIVERNQTNHLIFHATDTAGNQTSLTHSLISDMQAPTLTVLTPGEGATVAEGDVLLAGYAIDTNPGVVLTVDGASVSLAQDGYFETTLTLADGATPTVVVTAVDALGNAAPVVNRSFIVSNEASLTPVVSVLSPAYDATLTSSTLSLSLLIENPQALTALSVNSVDVMPVDTDVITIENVIADANGEIIIEYSSSAGTSQLTHRVIVESAAPTLPIVLNTLPGHTQSDQVAIYGQLDPNTTYHITGGLVDVVEGISDANGAFSLVVPLALNQNHFQP